MADMVDDGDGAGGAIALDWIGGADGLWTEVGRPPGVSVRAGSLEEPDIDATTGSELVLAIADGWRLGEAGLPVSGAGDCIEKRGVAG